MENQHIKTEGCHELSLEEIGLMNKIARLGIELGELVAKLQANDCLDQRWVDEGKTDLQKGLMALTRSVAAPISRSSRSTGCPAAHSCARRLLVWKGAF